MSRNILASVIVAVTALTACSASASAVDLNRSTQTDATTDRSPGSGELDGATGAAKTSGKRSRNRKRNGAVKCDRLKRKAMRTGRHYYWAKYNRCLRHNK